MQAYILYDYTNAALSLATTVPFVGWAATGGKWAIKANRALGAAKGVKKALPALDATFASMTRRSASF